MRIHAMLTVMITVSFNISAWAAKPDADSAQKAGDIKGSVNLCVGSSESVNVYIPGRSFFARTGSQGEFRLSYVPPGTYSIVIERHGQRYASESGIRVLSRQITDIGTLTVCTDLDGDTYDQSVDCDDTNPAINPGATEECGDGIDNNCNVQIDEGCAVCTDNDGDGYFAQQNCVPGGDCVDTDASINPGALEVCGDNIDNNCNGEVDEPDGVGNQTFYVDLDDDGYGDSNSAINVCVAPPGYVSTGGDCDDNNASVNPSAPELCDGLDNDCNPATTDGIEEPGYGQSCDGPDSDACTEGVYICDGVSGLVCDDTTGDNLEICDGTDNDCNGEIDEICQCILGQTQTQACGYDGPLVGICLAGMQVRNCSSDGQWGVWGSCDGAVVPQPEFCNAIDDDCDGEVDEDLVCP